MESGKDGTMKEEKSMLTGKKGITVFFHSVAVLALAFCILLIGACGAFFSYDSIEYYFENKPYEESPLLGNQVISDFVLACQVEEGRTLLYDDNGNLKEFEDYGFLYLTSEKKALHITLKDILVSAYLMEVFQNGGYQSGSAEIADSAAARIGEAQIESWLRRQMENGMPTDTEFLKWVSETQDQLGVSIFNRAIYNKEVFVLRTEENMDESGKVDISNIEYTTNLGSYLERQITAISEKLSYSSVNSLDAKKTNFQYRISSSEGDGRIGNCEQVEHPLFSVKISKYGDEVLLNKLSDFISNQELIDHLYGYEIYDGEFTIEGGLSQSLTVWDKYRIGEEIYQIFMAYLPLILVCTMVSLLVWLATLIMLICMAGHKDKSGKVTLCFLDKWYLEFLTIAVGLIFTLVVSMANTIGGANGITYWSSLMWGMACMVVIVALLYVLVMIYLFSLIRRGKAGVLWRSTLLAALIRWIKKIGREISEILTDGRKNSRRIFWYYSLYFLTNFLLIMMMFALWRSFERDGSLLILLFWIALFFFWLWMQKQLLKMLVRKNRQREALSNAVEEIRNGNLEYQVDAANFYTQEKKMADGINHIGEGLHAAVDSAMKSERMKTDLITNVSHDIKTPLTSIINYVDLMKREEIPNEKVQHYLDVLDKKSQRLKNLTEDLVEASKASSGNVKLEMIRLDFIELINQVNGEFKEKLETKNLVMVTQVPEGQAAIMADGRRLWRVLENLYGNVAKYAMERTRVYIDVEKTEQEVSFSMKNISEAPLNISPEELTERFTRGDVARTTEGSGLGLSIAKSLTELQKGRFEIYLDGDLFCVKVSFPLADSSMMKETDLQAGEAAALEVPVRQKEGEAGDEAGESIRQFRKQAEKVWEQMKHNSRKLCGKIGEIISKLWKKG